MPLAPTRRSARQTHPTPTPKRPPARRLAPLLLAALLPAGCAPSLRPAVDAQILPLMQEHRIPGLAVAVLHNGRTELFTYGVANRETGDPVTPDTLFELGSVSKTFTALLGAYAAAQGAFRSDDPVARRCPDLAGTAFDRITMDQLATYSAGGLPLQFPADVSNDRMLAYFRAWKPDFAPGAQRLYSNPSIGLFGLVAARSAGMDFADMMTRTILPALALHHTYLTVPPDQMPRYALGCTKDDQPIRVSPGVLDAQAYGIKSSASDMARYLQAHLHAPTAPTPDPTLARALAETRTPRFSVGPMTQALGWELYPYPVPLDDLLAGNSTDLALKPNPIDAPRTFPGAVLLNKTGSTNGFGAYVIVVPDEGLAVVLLANRNYPNPARIKAAHAILTAAAR